MYAKEVMIGWHGIAPAADGLPAEAAAEPIADVVTFPFFLASDSMLSLRICEAFGARMWLPVVHEAREGAVTWVPCWQAAHSTLRQ